MSTPGELSESVFLWNVNVPRSGLCDVVQKNPRARLALKQWPNGSTYSELGSFLESGRLSVLHSIGQDMTYWQRYGEPKLFLFLVLQIR